MTTEQPKKLRKPAVRQRPNAAEQPRPVMSFRIRADLHGRLKETAEIDGLAFSEEIERRLIRSFEDEQRIASLERHIDVMQQTERLLWPDESARILGQGFSMALAAARHASGQDWREDRSAALIVAGAMRRLMDRCSRDGVSLVAELFDGARIAATAERIVETVGPYLDKAMPPLPDRMFDVANWTGRCFYVNEFRDAATGEVLETVTGPEWDAADPEQRGDFGTGYMAAIARFKPIREKVDLETFVVHVLKDGTHKRIRSDLTPAGPGPQPEATPATVAPRDEGAARLIGIEAAGQDAPNWRNPRGMPPASVDDRNLFDRTVAELPLVQAERAADAKARERAPLDVGAGSPEAVAPPAAPKRRGRAKAPVEE